eukprot:9323907-Pyramimonas_sp.AAC.1
MWISIVVRAWIGGATRCLWLCVRRAQVMRPWCLAAADGEGQRRARDVRSALRGQSRVCVSVGP